MKCIRFSAIGLLVEAANFGQDLRNCRSVVFVALCVVKRGS